MFIIVLGKQNIFVNRENFIANVKYILIDHRRWGYEYRALSESNAHGIPVPETGC